MVTLLYVLRGYLLHAVGCRVFEDLSAICSWGVFHVPW